MALVHDQYDHCDTEWKKVSTAHTDTLIFDSPLSGLDCLPESPPPSNRHPPQTDLVIIPDIAEHPASLDDERDAAAAPQQKYNLTTIGELDQHLDFGSRQMLHDVGGGYTAENGDAHVGTGGGSFFSDGGGPISARASEGGGIAGTWNIHIVTIVTTSTGSRMGLGYPVHGSRLVHPSGSRS